MQLFFVYDLSYCKTETDDPKDAIIYFHPSQVTENQRCIICCQLVGMIQFFQSTFSCPKIITLQKGKFAIKLCSNYLFALEAKSGVPDNILLKQLRHVYNIFCFYHKNVNRVNRFYRKREDFLKKMENILNCCLPVSHCFDNDFLLAFDALPVFLVPEIQYASIYLQAIQLLQTCQKYAGVVAGCILFKNEILVTQLNSMISRYILLVKFIHEYYFSPEDIQVPFQLPSGIQIVRVFIKKKTLENINSFSKYFSKMTNKFHKVNSSKICSSDIDISSGSEGDIDSDTSENEWVVRPRCNSKCDKLNKTDNLKCNSKHLKLFDNTKDYTESIKEWEEDSDKCSNIWSGIVNCGDDESNICKRFLHKYGILHYPASHVSFNKLNFSDIEENCSFEQSDNDDEEDETLEMRLYIQYYMNSIMVLLVDSHTVQNVELIQLIWNSTLPVLSDLEVALQCHLINKCKNKTKSDSFVYLQHREKILNGCPKPDYSISDARILKSLQCIHEDFEKNSHLLDISTVICDRMIHACRSSIHEVYYLRLCDGDSIFSLGYLPTEAVNKLENKLAVFLPYT